MDDPVHRKRPVHWLPEPDHPSPIIFLTCCTKDRRRCLNRCEVHEALRDAWRKADLWRVGRYVVMPDHIHLFCAPTAGANTLQRWIAFWRSMTTRSLGDLRGELRQREYWDRQLRRQESYREKWEYVRHNPVRAGLVERPEDWPYQGELERLEWFGSD